MKIIEVKNFSFRYANGNRNSLENVTLDVEEGTFNVLCGKSGCGKSTLLRQLKSDLAPCGSRSGRICYYGQDLDEDCSQTAEPGNRICTAESGESDRNR